MSALLGVHRVAIRQFPGIRANIQRRLQSTPAKPASNPASTGAKASPAETASKPSKPPGLYNRMHKSHPYLTQTGLALVIWFIGDLSAQKFVPREPAPYDVERMARTLIIGGLAAAPAYAWFKWLSRSFDVGSKWLSIGVRVLVNQMAFTPVFNTYFFGMQRLLTGGTWEEIVERVVNTVPTSWVNSWKIWPPVMAINFAYVPLQYRSIFGGVVAIGWQTYLSFLNQRAAQIEVVEEQTETQAQKI